MKKSKRIIAFVAAAAIIFSFLFSSVFIIEKSQHRCTGADCSICAMLHTAENNINSVKAIIGDSSFIVCVAFILLFLICGKEIKFNSKTLIDLSVKISD